MCAAWATYHLHLLQFMQARSLVPLGYATTTHAPEQAAGLCAQHAWVLHVPLNQDFNHRLFEVIAAGVPQVAFGEPGQFSPHRHLAFRPDVFWPSLIGKVE